MKEWMLARYDRDQLQDIIRYGCSSGVSGLTYYSETCAIHDEYEDEIWDWLSNQSIELGSDSIVEHVSRWRCASSIGSMDRFKNYIVWAYAEALAYELDQEWSEHKNEDKVND